MGEAVAMGVLSVVGLVGGMAFGPAAADAIGTAEVLVGAPRHLAAVAGAPGAERIELRGPLPAALDAVAEQARRGRRVCLLASGDPGFFGIVRALGQRHPDQALAVHPAPSSVSLAFARLGLSWDDATVVSAHGRPLLDAVARIAGDKVAILTSPENPPEAVGVALVDAGWGRRAVSVLSRLGDPGEAITRTDLAGLAAGTFDPLSVVVVTAPEPTSGSAGLAWGLREDQFAHRGGMITKSEVRAVALGKLQLPPSGVLWDVGAGSGSVSVECARLRPGLRVLAIERRADDAARVRANAANHGVDVEVTEGDAPAVLAELPDPDRVFVGGGGLAVLDSCCARLRAGGVIVANYALMDRAVDAWRRLGNVVQVSVSRGAPLGSGGLGSGGLGSGGLHLAAENPVFVCWGAPGRGPE
ncbi:MAG: precorrin-6y C5,15-methyltransferase (decarboxylating) subunit CbiE [Acidimicrobiales bacterium]